MQLRQCFGVGSDAGLVGGDLLQQFLQLCGASVQVLLGLRKLLRQRLQQIAQLLLRFSVIGVVLCAAHGASRALFQVFAQLHHVLCLAQRVGCAHAVKCLLHHLEVSLHFLAFGPFHSHVGLVSSCGSGLCVNEGVSFRDMLPEHLCPLQQTEALSAFRSFALQCVEFFALYCRGVEHQFALPGVELCLQVVHFTLRFFGCVARFLLQPLQFGQFGLAFGVALHFGAEHGEFVLYEVKFVEHQLVHRERLAVQFQFLNLLEGNLEFLVFGSQCVLP